MDSVDTRVLWSERAIGIQGYGTQEENPQTWQRSNTRSTTPTSTMTDAQMRADMEALMARPIQTEQALMDTRQQVAAVPKVTAPLVDTRTIGKAPTFIGEHK